MTQSDWVSHETGAKRPDDAEKKKMARATEVTRRRRRSVDPGMLFSASGYDLAAGEQRDEEC